MLLEFRTRNYKSFADEMVFSMRPAPKQKGLDYSILSRKIGTKWYKGLCSAVIYGPNASGKTNIIGAMDTMKSIVLRGNINNTKATSLNAAASALELVPNCNSSAEPTEFAISFVDGGMLVDYALLIDFGSFMDADYPRKVLMEQLIINGKQVFLRNQALDVRLPSAIKEYINPSIGKKTGKLDDYARGSLSDTELFLNNGFKSIYAPKLVASIMNWFANKFTVIYHAEYMRAGRRLTDPKTDTLYIEKTLTDAAKAFGITANVLGYKPSKEQDGEDATLCSVVGNQLIPADIFESYGTIRFINEFPFVIMALLNGGTLVVDEFDASIHPMALMNIVNIFHDDSINRNGAQLIFNTHNPIFLDSALFRRDEIKFVERDEKTGCSTHYALSDFKTADGVRNGEDYMNNYFVSRYGAIRDIDFRPVIEAVFAESEAKKDG